MDAQKVVGRVFLIVGLILFVLDIYFIIHTLNFLRYSEEVPGKVIKLVRGRSSKGSASYSPVVSFKTLAGKKVEFESGVASSPPAYSEGDDVSVKYDPQAPENAEINSFFSMWFVVIIFSVLSFSFVPLGWFLLSLPEPKRSGKKSFDSFDENDASM